jgi:CBS domain-containing protein
MRHCQVENVMTTSPATVSPDTPLKDVAEILVGGRIGVVPVLTAQGQVAGVVAEGDLLRKEQLQRAGPARASPPPRPRPTSWTATRRPRWPAPAWRRRPG